MSLRTFLFAGGGTGGHIYPALAIAEQFAGAPSVDWRVLCSPRPLDAEILRGEQAPFSVIPARPFGLSPKTLLRFLWGWGDSVRAARACIREAKAQGEAHVIAMGGFVAAPVVRAARVERVPITLVNLDAVPGRANRWIARHAEACFTAATLAGVDWTSVPPIVRRAALAPGPPTHCRRSLGLDPGRPTLFVTGASQGARSINDLMAALLREHRQTFVQGGWQVIHQTGKGEVDATRRAYADAGVPAMVQPYFKAMGMPWGAADLAISRAGAGSVGEAWANRVPTIFFPYPFHKDQHQEQNAKPLSSIGAASILRDLVDPAPNARAHAPAIVELLTSDAKRERMRAAFANLPPADGAARIAGALLARR
jgi:UDP-N-acetylglucosamine--N-acetylmuramyl-(pentapeptide) pyrophosphoryl-undecaprenol N-acetylglucosamine transferase